MSEHIPELILEMPEKEKKTELVQAYSDELSKLSEQEQETVKQFSQQIDLTQTSVILRYGAKAQEKVADQGSWRCRKSNYRPCGGAEGL